MRVTVLNESNGGVAVSGGGGGGELKGSAQVRMQIDAHSTHSQRRMASTRCGMTSVSLSF